MYEDILDEKKTEIKKFRCISCNKPLEKEYWCPDCNVKRKEEIRDTEDGL